MLFKMPSWNPSGKDRPPMLALDNYVQWKSKFKRYRDTKPNSKLIYYCLVNPPHIFTWVEQTSPVSEGSLETHTEGYMETYKNVSLDIWDQLNVEAEAVQIILTRINNDIYSIFDACPNACEIPQQAATKNKGKAIVNSPQPVYDQEPAMVAEDDEMSKEKEIDKLMALISLSFKKIYNPTNNNLRTSSNTRNKGNVRNQNRQRMQLITRRRCYYELEARYLYMVQIQEVTLDVADNSGPIFDVETLQKVQHDDDNYNVFANEREHPKQPEFINDTYIDEHNIIIDSLDMSHDREQDDQDDNNDLAKERDLLASSIEKQKCEIDDSENRNKFLKSSNKTLIDKLKGAIKDFKTKNKSLKSSNNHFKEANNELSKTNQLMFKDLKDFQDELEKRHDVNYTSKVELECAKAKTELLSYKTESQKSINKYSYQINELNQKISDMKKELVAHQETISIMSQQKKDQKKFYKTHEEKNLKKSLLWKIKSKFWTILFTKPVNQTKQSIVVPISTREPKQTVNQSATTFLKRIVATESTNPKPKSTIRKRYEQISKTCKWWYSKITPPGYQWKPKTYIVNVKPNLIEIIIFIVDSMCSKHMTGNLKLLSNFVEQFLGMVKFRNNQNALILGYKDLVQGNGNDLLISSRGTDLYSINIPDTSTPNPICLVAKATSSQAWLWHRCLSHINFNTIKLLSKYDIVTGLSKLKFIKVHLCSSCELGIAKRKSFNTKATTSSKRWLQILHMDLCGPIRVESFNGKKYVLIIVDDYSRYTWTRFLRSKNETLEILIDFLKLVQRGIQAQVRTVRTDKGTKFLNKTFHAYFDQEGIKHQMPTTRTSKQNSVIERQNRTLVEVARIMLSAAKVPLFFWAEAIARTCFTQNRSLVIPRHEKTPYHIINGREPSFKLFYIFASLCYIAKNVMSKSFDVTAVDAPNQRQQQNINPSTSITVTVDIPPLIIQTTPETTNQAPTQALIVTAIENINK
uniref:Integrase catalytic domain-containing protein n=1 Tax=Tanacetum cinerariifolium TaxID=118510 RepID=A0A6L2N1N3_TANCI|nr:hypothetical protein [Tanacetum cinerariifolium]